MSVKLKGIDISNWQKGISFDAIEKAGVEFIIMRAGCGTNKDRSVNTFVSECNNRDIPYGFYWYSYAKSVDEAKKEAAKCINVIKEYSKPAYPVFFDIEDKSQISGFTKKERTDMVIAFCEEIKKAGYIPGFYTNPSWLEKYLEKDRLVGVYDLWLACWTNSPDVKARFQYGQKMWQWGADNIDGREVDGNLSYRDYRTNEEAAELKPVKTVGELAVEVIQGKWGNGSARKKRLTEAGYDYSEVQKKVDELMGIANKKTVDEIAREVIQGKWGNGDERKKRLTAAGYNYSEVQKRVNKLL